MVHKSAVTQWVESRTANLTGVVSSGVVIGVQALLSCMPLPRSKSQIFTGDTWRETDGGFLKEWNGLHHGWQTQGLGAKASPASYFVWPAKKNCLRQLA